MRKWILLLLALLFTGVMTVECAAAESSDKKKSSRKAKRDKKKGVSRSRLISTLRREFRQIHDIQRRALKNKDNADKVAEYSKEIKARFKKLGPFVKQMGKIEGAELLGDINKFVQAGKKLAPAGKEVTDAEALVLLQQKQIEQIENYRKPE